MIASFYRSLAVALLLPGAALASDHAAATAPGGVVGGAEVATAMVRIDTNKPGWTVKLVELRGSASGSNGVTASSAHWRDVCVAPCSFEIDAGMRELFGGDDGKVVASRKFELDGQVELYAEPGSTALLKAGQVLGSLGLTGMLVGVGLAAAGIAQGVNPDLQGPGLPNFGSIGIAVGATSAAVFGGSFALMKTNTGKWTIRSSTDS